MPLSIDVEPLPQPLTDRVEPPPKRDSWAGLPTMILAKDQQDHPDIRRPELLEMEKWWRKGDILLGGTDAVLAHADELIPPLGNDEQNEERDARLRKLVVTPFYHDHIDRLVARPFGRPITFSGLPDDEKLPDELDHIKTNADGRGKSFTALLRDHLFEAVHRSGDCLLADLPDQDMPTNYGKQLDAKVVIRRLSLRDILGWEYRVDGEQLVTTMLRLREEVQVRVGKFGSACKTGIRIIQASTPATPTSDPVEGYSVLYLKDQKGNWLLDQDTARPYVRDRIYLEATWTNQITATQGQSTMTHLADLNVSYVLADTEQQYGASYARVSTMWTVAAEGPADQGGGLGTDATAQPTRKPPKRVNRGHLRHIRLPFDASIGLLESSGSGLAAGRAELDNLEKRMDRFGASHTDTTAGVTATSIRSDDDRDTSNLRSWVGRVETCATRTLRNCAELLGTPELLGPDFQVHLWRDWSEAMERDAAMANVFSAWDRHLVPARVVHQSLRRFGTLTEEDKTPELLKEAQDEQAQQGDQMAAAALDQALRGAAAFGGGHAGADGGMPAAGGMPPGADPGGGGDAPADPEAKA